MQTHWQQLELICPAAYVERLSDLLLEYGATSVITEAVDQAEILFEKQIGRADQLWASNKIKGIFEADADCALVIQKLKSTFEPAILQSATCTILQDQEWEKNWMDTYQPIQITEKLWICPSWHEPKAPDAINIFLDPGLAFGTGTHPTTAMCLRWLEKNIQGNETIIDLGCGSGILAICALKLGCARAIAIDIDPQALNVTKENAEKNGIDPARLITKLAPAQNFEPVDLVVANILANPLIELASYINSLTKSQGKIALSGLLNEQASNVKKAYAPWFSMDNFDIQDNWVCLKGNKK